MEGTAFCRWGKNYPPPSVVRRKSEVELYRDGKEVAFLSFKENLRIVLYGQEILFCLFDDVFLTP